jgi:protoporphyrinogen oxidase
MFLRKPVKQIAVIGSGLTGMTAALRLAQKGYQVSLFEKQNYLGGLASGFQLQDGTPLERAYHFLYKTDRDVIGLAEELGLKNKIHFHESSIGAFFQGQLYSFMTPMDLIRFRPLSLLARIRTGLVAVYLQRAKKWKALSRISALDWLRKFNGEEAARILWAPLLKGKFDVYFDKVPMAWLWRRIQIRQQSKDPGDLREKLGYPEGGFSAIVNALEEELRRLGVRIHTQTSLQEIGFDTSLAQPFIKIQDKTLHFDSIASTVPSSTFSHLISRDPAVSVEYQSQLKSVDYLAAVTMVFTTSKALSPYFWHQIHDADSPFLLLLSLSALTGTKPFAGRHVYYIGDYVKIDDPLFSLTEIEIKTRWLAGLKKLFPNFEESQILETHVFKFANAQHVATLGYEDKVLPLETPLPRVYFSNFAQIYPDDRGTNYAVRDGQRLCDQIHQELKNEEFQEPTTFPSEVLASR